MKTVKTMKNRRTDTTEAVDAGRTEAVGKETNLQREKETSAHLNRQSTKPVPGTVNEYVRQQWCYK